MSAQLDTFLVEFICTIADKGSPGNPVEKFERFLSKQSRAFAVEEYIVSKNKFTNDAGWVEWFAEHPGEQEAFVAVFLVEKKDKEFFDGLFAEFTAEKEKRTHQSPSEPTKGLS